MRLQEDGRRLGGRADFKLISPMYSACTSRKRVQRKFGIQERRATLFGFL